MLEFVRRNRIVFTSGSLLLISLLSLSVGARTHQRLDPLTGAVLEGMRPLQAVLSPFGVVGQTIATSPHSARVLLITDHNSGVDAVVQRSRARGIVEGALDGRCVMKYLKRGEDAEVDDRVVTSGLDGIFPKGII